MVWAVLSIFHPLLTVFDNNCQIYSQRPNKSITLSLSISRIQEVLVKSLLVASSSSKLVIALIKEVSYIVASHYYKLYFFNKTAFPILLFIKFILHNFWIMSFIIILSLLKLLGLVSIFRYKNLQNLVLFYK